MTVEYLLVACLSGNLPPVPHRMPLSGHRSVLRAPVVHAFSAQRLLWVLRSATSPGRHQLKWVETSLYASHTSLDATRAALWVFV